MHHQFSNSLHYPLERHVARSAAKSSCYPVKPKAGSFLLSVHLREKTQLPLQLAADYSFDNLNISTNETHGKSWHTAENPAYMILLDGHLYLDSCGTIDNKTNLDKLLHSISMSTIQKGLQKIAGGIFSLIIIDKQRRKLFVSGDRLGAMPLYFSMQNDELMISSNQFNFTNKTMRDFAAVEFLKYGYLPFSASFFEGVERLLPGQTLSMTLPKGELIKSEPQVFEFKPLQNRVTELHEAGEMLHQACAKYFGRLRDSNYALSPMGVGDSSLALVWMRFKEPALFHLPVVSANHIEELLPMRIAEHYNFPVTQTAFEEKHLLAQTDRLPELYRVAGSLEFTKVLASHDAVRSIKPDYYIDAFMSDAVFQTHAADPVHESQRGGFAPDSHNSPIRSIDYYQSQLYNSPYAIKNDDMGSILSKEYEVWFLNSARGTLEVNRLAGHVHEDFIESLNNYTLHRCLRSMLPVSLAPEVNTLAPFADYSIMQTFYDIDRSLRQNHIFYSYYWKTFFPEIAEVHQKAIKEAPRKVNQPKLGNRVKHILKKVSGKSEASISNKKASLDALCEYKLADQALNHPSDLWPKDIVRKIAQMGHGETLQDELKIRYITLDTYLKRSEKA
ncbi:MAG: hypothetical protein ACRBF0_21665 [Calditrichia bacterium]